MSSKARAVFFGRPPGSFLLMKWMTCSFIFGGPPSVEGGRVTCLRARPRRKSFARRCTLKPTSTIAVRTNLIVSGFVALSMNIAAALAGRKLFCPILRSRLRMFIDTSPKSMFTGHGDAHLWHTVQWSDTSSNCSQCLIETPRRVCSSYRKASTRSEVARILLRGLYSRFERGTCVAHTGLHLPQRRQSLIELLIAPMSDCCMISDSWPMRPNEGVYAFVRSAYTEPARSSC